MRTSAVLHRVLSGTDADRVVRTLRKLGRHGIRHWVLTGGLAVEVHRLQRGRPASVRALSDIDFLADAFDAVPRSLADDFLFRHIHPFDPPGKTMLQLVDAESALRIDVFRAYGGTLSRSSNLNLSTGMIQLISLEDLIARMARLAFDLAAQMPTPVKHVADFLRLTELIDPTAVETAWRDHRKAGHPTTFKETSRLLQDLIATCSDLLITPDYSKDAVVVCTRCASTGAFRLADPTVIRSLLGYC